MTVIRTAGACLSLLSAMVCGGLLAANAAPGPGVFAGEPAAAGRPAAVVRRCTAVPDGLFVDLHCREDVPVPAGLRIR